MAQLMPRPPTTGLHWTRWALLAITLAMGAALILTGITGWFSAQQASREVVKANARDLSGALRRELRRADGPPGDALPEAVEALAEQGLRFAALINPEGEIIASGGEPVEPLDDVVEHARGHKRDVPEAVGDRIRVVSSTRPPRQRRGRGERGPRRGPPPLVVVIEFEPLLAQSVAAHAVGTLVTGVIAALVLLFVAIILWRLAGKADRAAAQLERDRHLRTLGEMSAVLGHEIRNPLASLKGHAQLLLEKLPEDHPGHRKAERVVREALRLERLTTEVLEFARSGALDLRDHDPAEVAREAIDLSGAAERVTLTTAGAPEAWALDRPRMVQVLINLVRNGVQASPDAAPVDVVVASEAGALVYTVRDRGEGIPTGEEERVFEPFYTKGIQGTGLGLAIARRIVDGHGGTISTHDHPEGGARFRIELTGRRA